MQLLRSLLCGLLTCFVAIAFAPENFAHGMSHDKGARAGFTQQADCNGVQAKPEQGQGDHEHAPGEPCQDCCHYGHCHMKAAPASSESVRAAHWSNAKLGFGLAPRFADAPEAREPDPERT
jgi:hypothetical protein